MLSLSIRKSDFGGGQNVVHPIFLRFTRGRIREQGKALDKIKPGIRSAEMGLVDTTAQIWVDSELME